MYEPSDHFVEIIRRAFGDLTTLAGKPWIDRGISNAAKRLGVAPGYSDEVMEVVGVWSFGFEAGALRALHFARIVLSDPAVRGREDDALKLIERGLGHAEILASLRADQPTGERAIGTVIAFDRKGGKA